MRFEKRRKTEVYEGDLTPMIDMTFQLIAFFMVLINFQQTEQHEEILLPKSELAKPPEKPLDYPITVNVTKEHHVILGGQELTSLDQLKPVLRREAQILKALERPLNEATIVIRAHRLAKIGFVQKLIQTCQDVGFETFSLRAKEDLAGR